MNNKKEDGRLQAFKRGVTAALGRGPTLTYDGNPESPRSVAFDRGMNFGERVLETARLWKGGPCGSLPEGK